MAVIRQLECKRCENKWIPRSFIKPKVCPECNTKLWQTPKKNKKGLK